MKEREVGKIVHFYDKICVGIILLKGTLKVGENIHIKGTKTDFNQVVESLQIEHGNVETAKAKQEIGLKTSQPVHEHDRVYKLVEEKEKKLKKPAKKAAKTKKTSKAKKTKKAKK